MNQRLSLCLTLLLLGAQPLAAQTLRIYHIDVEQAAATLFVAPGGRTLLVDSGKNGHGSRIQRAMTELGVTQIDFFVATHYHEDHFGGIDDLVDLKVPVLEAFDRGAKDTVPQSTRNQPTWRGYLRTVGEDARPLHNGETIQLDPLMTVTCIGSGGTVIGETSSTPPEDENDKSVSLLITFAGFRYFIGGDTESPTEAKIAARDLAMNVDVYHANHHGSHSSTSAAFMSDARPSVVIISNGNRADFGHPRQVTLNTLAALNPPATVFQTNKYLAGGPLPFGNVPDEFIADPQTSDDDGNILMTVDGAAGTYTVAYGSTTKDFMTKAPASGTPTTLSDVVIETVLPNPVGSDERLEEVRVRNKGTQSVSLQGWTLRDRSGLHWDLTGNIAANQSRRFRRNGQEMTLNNAGDEIALEDAMQVEQDRFTYSSSTEGTVIKTLH